MAIKNTMFDDLDGSMIEGDNGGTVKFSLQGTNYAVELTRENEQKLAAALAPFIAVARTEQGLARTATPVEEPVSTEARSYELRDARTWLLDNGHDVSRRGPIQEHFLKIFEEANGLA